MNIFSALKGIFKKTQKKRAIRLTSNQTVRQTSNQTQEEPVYIQSNLDANLAWLKEKLADCADAEFRSIRIGKNKNLAGCLVFFDGLVDSERISESVLKPLILFDVEASREKSVTQAIYDQLMVVGVVDAESDLNSFVMKLLAGRAGLLLEGQQTGFTIEVIGWQDRSIEEPKSEAVIKGQQAGFTENIRVNGSIIRRIIKNPDLKIERLTMGRITHTQVNLVYLKGVVMPGLVEEARQRLNRIDVDGLITIGNIQEMIQDAPYSVFTQSYTTERPDRACSSLLEGRLLIIMNNTPFVIIVPSIITHLMQSPEDYNTTYLYASFIRLLRFMALSIVLIFPGFYVAIFSYHHVMIPTQLLLSIAQVREGLPFPIFMEMLALEFTFEMLREAGVRLPKAIGQTVSIVGALVIGQAAVAANLVSPPSVIVVALTAIAAFIIPITEGSDSIRLLRFPILVLSGVFGMLGLMVCSLLILVHLSTIRSFGVPYLTPVAPLRFSDWKDFLIRAPMWSMKTRPSEPGKRNLKRQGRWPLRGGK